MKVKNIKKIIISGALLFALFTSPLVAHDFSSGSFFPNRDNIQLYNDLMIGANDIVIGVEDVPYVNEVDLIKRSFARGARVDEGIVMEPLSVKWIEGNISASSTYETLTFALANDRSARVNVGATVVAGSVVQSRNYILNTQSNSIPISQFKKLLEGVGNIDDVMNVNMSYKSVTRNIQSYYLDTDLNSIPLQAGSYPITYSFYDMEERYAVTSYLTLLAGNKPTLSVPQKQVINVDDGDVYDVYKNVSYHDVEDGTSLSLSVSGDDTVRQAISKKSYGSYEVVYSVKDSDENITNATQEVIITHDEGDMKHYELYAENMMINKSLVRTNDQAIINSTKAFGKELNNNSNEQVIVVDKGGYSSTVGRYEITLALKSDMTNTKKVIIKVVDGEVVEGTNYFISAEDITLIKPESLTLTDDIIKSIMRVESLSKHTNSDGDVSVDGSSINEESLYPIKFSVVQDQSATITKGMDLKITDVDDSGYLISAQDYTVSKQVIETLTDDDIIALAKAQAFHIDDLGKPLKIMIKDGFKKSVGKSDVTFFIKNHEESFVTVTQTVLDETYHLEADAAEVKIMEFNKDAQSNHLSQSLINKTNAQAYKLSGNEKIEYDVYLDDKLQLYKSSNKKEPVVMKKEKATNSKGAVATVVKIMFNE